MKDFPAQFKDAIVTLTKSIPFLGVFYTYYDERQQTKIAHFIDEFKQGLISSEILEVAKDDIFHNAYITIEIIKKIRQNEKIQFFAKLFAGYLNNIHSEGNSEQVHDDYEELAFVMEKITVKEFELLMLLYEKEQLHPNYSTELLPHTELYWESFTQKARTQLQLEINTVNAMLAKLNGTGLYLTITGTYYGYTGNRGHLTPIFYKMIQMIEKSVKNK